MKKLHLGCGTDIRAGYINLDCVTLDGVDVVHDLSTYPYPFEDNYFDEILAIDVLEHLEDTIAVMEELWRIAKNEAHVIIKVPFWNSIEFITDITHKRQFNQYSLDFFDPATHRHKKRSYYSTATFFITKKTYFIRFFGYKGITWRPAKFVLNRLSQFFCNIIRAIQWDLKVKK